MKLYFDFETTSDLDLKIVGLDNYARHLSTQVLCMGYAFDGQPAQSWEPHLEPMPTELREALTDPTILKLAWNVSFELNILASVLHIEIPLTQFLDPMAHARYISLPGSLGDCGDVLKINAGKDKDGKRLMKMFSIPIKATKTQIKKGMPAVYQKDWNSDPEDWAKFVAYCVQDVEALRAIALYLNTLEMYPTIEYKVWLLDMLINHRGIAVDRTFVDSAAQMAYAETQKWKEELAQLTGLPNPNSTAQLGGWLRERGYAFDSIDEEHRAQALACDDLDPEVRAVLEVKEKLGGTSYNKLETIQRLISDDGRLRHQFIYHKAHTGRWSSVGVQLHNLARGEKAVADRMDEVTAAIRSGFIPAGMHTMDCITGTLRACFCAPEGCVLDVCDLAGIEYRVLAWLSECEPMLEVLRKGLCPHKSFAVIIFKVAYEEVSGEQRQKAKPFVFGAGYGQGWQALQATAKGYGVTFTEAECRSIIAVYRETYADVVGWWSALEMCALCAVREKRVVPLDYITFDGSDPRVLKVLLPSGRSLHYFEPTIEATEEENVIRQQLTYMSSTAKGWRHNHTYGSKICENIVQAVARDILVMGMFGAHKRGLEIVGHVHDELIVESPLQVSGLAPLRESMIQRPPWGDDSLLLDAKGFQTAYYKKD